MTTWWHGFAAGSMLTALLYDLWLWQPGQLVLDLVGLLFIAFLRLTSEGCNGTPHA